MIYHPFRHLGLKAISIALALITWLAVSGEQIVERSLRVPLEMQNIPERLELVDIPPPSVDVRVKGGSSLLSRLSAGDVVAVLDLSLAKPGRRFMPLSVDAAHGPVGVEVVQVSPSTIPLEFQLTATRSIPVVPTIDGSPAPGYAIDATTVEPPSAEVVGPENVLRELRTVATEPISVAGATGPVREALTLGVTGHGLRLKTPGKALVTVNIQPVQVERVIAGVPVRGRNVPSRLNASFTPASVAVRVKGTEAVLAAVTAGRLAAFVDLAGLAPGRYNLPIRVEPPTNVQILQIQPSSVAARVR